MSNSPKKFIFLKFCLFIGFYLINILTKQTKTDFDFLCLIFLLKINNNVTYFYLKFIFNRTFSRSHGIHLLRLLRGYGNPGLRWEPWSIGYGRRLMYQRCGFESQHHILNGHFPHLLVVQIVMFVEKDRK